MLIEWAMSAGSPWLSNSSIAMAMAFRSVIGLAVR